MSRKYAASASERFVYQNDRTEAIRSGKCLVNLVKEMQQIDRMMLRLRQLQLSVTDDEVLAAIDKQLDVLHDMRSETIADMSLL